MALQDVVPAATGRDVVDDRLAVGNCGRTTGGLVLKANVIAVVNGAAAGVFGKGDGGQEGGDDREVELHFEGYEVFGLRKIGRICREEVVWKTGGFFAVDIEERYCPRLHGLLYLLASKQSTN